MCKNIFKDFIHSLLERGEGKEEREEEKHQYVVASCTPPTEDLAYNPGMYPDWELNQRPFGSQDGTQSTEPYQPGWYLRNYNYFPILKLFLKDRVALE